MQSDEEGERTPTPQTTMVLEDSRDAAGAAGSSFYPARDDEAGPLIEENDEEIEEHIAAHHSTAPHSLLDSPGQRHHPHHHQQQQQHEENEEEDINETDDGPVHIEEEPHPGDEVFLLAVPSEYNCGQGNLLAYTFDVPDPSKPDEHKKKVFYHTESIRERHIDKHGPYRNKQQQQQSGLHSGGKNGSNNDEHAASSASSEYNPLVTMIECGYVSPETGAYRFAVCKIDEQINKPFSEYFSATTLMKSIRCRSLLKLCVCPQHRQTVLVDPLNDSVICASLFPNTSASTNTPARGGLFSTGGAATTSTGDGNELADGDETVWRIAVEAKDGYVRFFECERPAHCLCSLPTLFRFDMEAS